MNTKSFIGAIGIVAIAVAGFFGIRYLIHNVINTPPLSREELEERINADNPWQHITIESYPQNVSLDSLVGFLEGKGVSEPLMEDGKEFDFHKAPQLLYSIIIKNNDYRVDSLGSCNVITEDGFTITSRHIVDPVIDGEARIIFFDPARRIFSDSKVLAHSAKYDLALLQTNVPPKTYKGLLLANGELTDDSASCTLLLDRQEISQEMTSLDLTKTFPYTSTELIDQRVIYYNGLSHTQQEGGNIWERTLRVSKLQNIIQGFDSRATSGAGYFTEKGIYQGPLLRIEPSGDYGESLIFASPMTVRALVSKYVANKK
ncbi:MAG: hypothetical protein AABX10_00705 [Nanoarchaeota archaeon]